MVSREQKILKVLTELNGQTVRELSDKIFGQGSHPSSINSECNYLLQCGKVTRNKVAGLYRYYLVEKMDQSIVEIDISQSSYEPLSEDHLKVILQKYLIDAGWEVKIAWGRTRGIDIDANREKERWIIEVKGSGSLQPMRVNYFIGILGEILQRMDDPKAKYSIALPDLKQYRGLWGRLPKLAKERTQIKALFINSEGNIEEI